MPGVWQHEQTVKAQQRNDNSVNTSKRRGNLTLQCLISTALMQPPLGLIIGQFRFSYAHVAMHTWKNARASLKKRTYI